jgi:hypothetical protein
MEILISGSRCSACKERTACSPVSLTSAKMIALFILLAFALSAAVPAYATTYNVNTTGDTHICGSPCSLRGAIEQANAGGAGPHTINLPANTYNLTLGELQMGNATGQSITIIGAGSGTTIIHQTTTGGSRVFKLDPSMLGNIAVSISGVTISGGVGDTYGGGGILGGGRVGGGAGDSLTINNCVITGNSTTNGNNGGGISWGGGGDLSIQNSTISNNTASQAVGGGVAFNNGAGNPGNLTITNTTFAGNTASSGVGAGQGGGLFMSLDTGSTASISDSTFSSNSAQSFDSADPGRGGAIYHASGALTISGTTFTGNSATTANGGNGEGGAIYSNSGAMTAHNNFFSGDTAFSGSGIFRLDSVQVDATNDWWGCNAGPGTAGCDTVTTYVNYANWINPFLTVTKAGIGTVTAIPDGGSDTLAWVGNTGTAGYAPGTHVNIAAAAGTRYTFNGWSGGTCSGNGSPCSVIMDSAKSVTATFYYYTGEPCVNPPFNIGGTMYNDATIKTAYNRLVGGNMLKIRALDFTENPLNLDLSMSVQVSGGYNCDFSSNTGSTTVHGTLTISGGPVTVEKLIIK